MKNEDKTVAKGDGIEITQTMMDKLHKGQTVKLPNGSTLTFVEKNKKDIKEGTWSVLPDQIPSFINAIEKIKDEYHGIVGDDTVFNNLDGAIEAAEELMMNTAKVTPEMPGLEGTRDALDNLEEELFVRRMKHRAGIIK